MMVSGAVGMVVTRFTIMKPYQKLARALMDESWRSTD
jgi:hypothetical protein